MNKLRKLVNIVVADATRQAAENAVWTYDDALEPELVELGQVAFARARKQIAARAWERKVKASKRFITTPENGD